MRWLSHTGRHCRDVDIGGVFDPTPTLDILGASLSAKSGDYLGAGASVLGAAIPFAGDLAKTGKIAKGIDKISDAIDAAKGADNSISPNVQNVLNTISDLKKAGGEVKANALKAVDKQEVNMTFKDTDGTKLDLRVETHKLSPSVGGNGVTPQRYLNATVTNSNGNVVKMKHINGGYKILE